MRESSGVLECVINISEGRRPEAVDAIAAAAGDHLLDVHRDPDHHRAVLTVAGPAVQEAARGVVVAAVERLSLVGHVGVHPRFGVVDVVPFAPVAPEFALTDALAARDAFAQWAARHLALPCFLYGPERTLPEVRRRAFADLAPDVGPGAPHPSAGAVAVGARPVLVAYNLWLSNADLGTARRIAASLRGPGVRALGLALGQAVQVSCNLVDPASVGPAEVYDAVAGHAAIERAELVGLVPAWVLGSVPRSRWAELGLKDGDTIEARLERAGLDGGRR